MFFFWGVERELLQSLLFELKITSTSQFKKLHLLLEREGTKKDGQDVLIFFLELVLSPECK